jgi:hypothetical protein
LPVRGGVQAELSALCQFVLLEESDALPVRLVLVIARRLRYGGRDGGDEPTMFVCRVNNRRTACSIRWDLMAHSRQMKPV